MDLVPKLREIAQHRDAFVKHSRMKVIDNLILQSGLGMTIDSPAFRSLRITLGNYLADLEQIQSDTAARNLEQAMADMDHSRTLRCLSGGCR